MAKCRKSEEKEPEDAKMTAILAVLKPGQSIASISDTGPGCVTFVTYPDYQKVRVYYG